MTGGKNKQPLGYTIVEVLIVLAVSGMMFVIAATFITGKQEKASFTAGVNEMASRIQDTIEQVIDGRYSDVPLNCNAGANDLRFTSSAAPNQGHNSDCTFLGKMLHFSENGPWGAANAANHYEVFSIAGARDDSTGQVATSLATSTPTPIDPYFGSGGSPPNLTSQSSIPQGLTASVHIDNSFKSYAFGFLQSQGSINGGVLQNGAQSVYLVYSSAASAASETEAAAAQNIGDNTPSSNLQTANQAAVCLTDGTRYAIITVGSNNAQLSVSVKQLGVAASCGPY